MARARTQRLVALSVVLAAAVALPGCRGVGCCTDWFTAGASTPFDYSPVPESPRRTAPEQVPPPGATKTGGNQFRIPPELPGAEAPPLRLPPFDATESPEERRSAIESLFPNSPSTAPADMPAADAAPLTLAELQAIAVANSPVIRLAAAEVDAARGLAIQAGLPPNPIVGYEGDSLGTALTAGYNGLFFSQEFVTAGKRQYARFAALMKMQAARQDLRKARVALASSVRRGYFDALVSRERLRYARAMAALSDKVYRGQVGLVVAGEAAAFQPLQLRVFAAQAQNQVVQAENQVNAAWRTLAAALGTPHLARTALSGSAEAAAPTIPYEVAAALLVERHTDLAAARATIASANYNVRLQEVTPIPNVTVYSAIQHDDTSSRNAVAANVQVGMPIPLYDRNQGNIAAARAESIRAGQDLTTIQNSLLSRLGAIDARYAGSRTVARNYREEILPDQVRVYRGAYESYRQASQDVDFAQLVVAQQSLAAALTQYVDALGEQWNAAVDLAELLQVDDFFATDAPVGPDA